MYVCMYVCVCMYIYIYIHIPCKPKHVGAVLLILKYFNNFTFFNIVCISWKLKCCSLENRFTVYLAVTFSRCVGCQKGQQMVVPSGHFFSFGNSQKSQGAKAGE